MYNMVNRLYCLSFDYQHRSPTPNELDDYDKLSLKERLFSIGLRFCLF